MKENPGTEGKGYFELHKEDKILIFFIGYLL